MYCVLLYQAWSVFSKNIALIGRFSAYSKKEEL